MCEGTRTSGVRPIYVLIYFAAVHHANTRRLIKSGCLDQVYLSKLCISNAYLTSVHPSVTDLADLRPCATAHVIVVYAIVHGGDGSRRRPIHVV
jgi:hypothetical protein